MIYSFGLLLPVISTTFGAGKTEASLVHTLMSLMTLGSGPVVAEAIKKFGHCLVSVVGTLLAMAGLAAAGLYVSHTNEPAIAMLYLFVGILTGFGFGLMYTTAMDIIERYFDQHLGLANGIAAAGSGLGQFALAQLLHFILQRFSLPHTFFCLAGLVAVTLPFMLIYRTPSEQEGKHAEPADTQQLDDVKTRNPSSTISSIVGLCGSNLMLLRNTSVLLMLVPVSWSSSAYPVCLSSPQIELRLGGWTAPPPASCSASLASPQFSADSRTRMLSPQLAPHS